MHLYDVIIVALASLAIIVPFIVTLLNRRPERDKADAEIEASGASVESDSVRAANDAVHAMLAIVTPLREKIGELSGQVESLTVQNTRLTGQIELLTRQNADLQATIHELQQMLAQKNTSD